MGIEDEDELSELEEKGLNLNVRVNLNKSSLKEFTETGLRTKILESTVDHLLKELTPDRMRAFMNQMLEDSLKNIGRWEIQQAIEKKRKEVLEAYVNTPAVARRIDLGIQAAVDQAITDMPNDLREAVKSEFHAAFRKGLGLRER